MIFEHIHYGIYGVILNEGKNKILLIKKTRGPYMNMLDLPGGSPEGRESKQNTLIREIKEETGANVIRMMQREVFSFTYKYSKNDQEHVLIHNGHLFLTKIDENIQKKIHSSDTEGCIWIELKNLEQNQITPLIRRALEIYKIP